MFFLAIGIFMAGILLGSESRHVALWRIGGGAACLATLLALNLHNFMRALFGYCARARFPNELYVEVQQWDYSAGVLFHGGFATFAAIGTALAAIAAIAWGSRLVRGVAASVLAFMAAIAAMCWVYVYGGVRWNAPLPNYLELPAYPVYAVVGLLGATAAINRLSTRTEIAARCRLVLTHPITQFAIVLLLPALGIWSVAAAPRPKNNEFELVGGLTPALPADADTSSRPPATDDDDEAASLLANGPAFDHALRLLRAGLPDADVGIHLNLSALAPLCLALLSPDLLDAAGHLSPAGRHARRHLLQPFQRLGREQVGLQHHLGADPGHDLRGLERLKARLERRRLSGLGLERRLNDTSLRSVAGLTLRNRLGDLAGDQFADRFERTARIGTNAGEHVVVAGLPLGRRPAVGPGDGGGDRRNLGGLHGSAG
jgi:hypothetical protein